MKYRGLLAFSNFEIAELSTRSTESSSSKTQKLNCAN
ncbi:hypothetical protein D908_16584 [Vibrio mimicus CAIM 602]|nr:hypothetical protein D908_16584 [Vibrio mimicus CAIM 602]